MAEIPKENTVSREFARGNFHEILPLLMLLPTPAYSKPWQHCGIPYATTTDSNQQFSDDKRVVYPPHKLCVSSVLMFHSGIGHI